MRPCRGMDRPVKGLQPHVTVTVLGNVSPGNGNGRRYGYAVLRGPIRSPAHAPWSDPNTCCTLDVGLTALTASVSAPLPAVKRHELCTPSTCARPWKMGRQERQGRSADARQTGGPVPGAAHPRAPAQRGGPRRRPAASEPAEVVVETVPAPDAAAIIARWGARLAQLGRERGERS